MRIGEYYHGEIEASLDQIKTVQDFVDHFKPEKIVISENHVDSDSDEELQSDEDREIEAPIEVFKFNHGQEMPFELPPGYCLEGGAARGIVLSTLGHKVLPPRDYDIIGIKELNPDPSLKLELSEKYMPDDYQHGYGVEEDNIERYFKTRDFTINEVFADKENAYITAQGLEDLLNKCIRPSDFEKHSWYSSQSYEVGVHPKLAMKAIRLHAEFEELYGKGNIEDIAQWQWDFHEVPLFHLALALNKACQMGDKVSIRFYAKLIELGTIDFMENSQLPSGQNVADLAANIRYKMSEQGRDPFDYSDPSLSKTIELLESNQDYEEDFLHYEELAEKYVK